MGLVISGCRDEVQRGEWDQDVEVVEGVEPSRARKATITELKGNFSGQGKETMKHGEVLPAEVRDGVHILTAGHQQ